MKRHEWQSEGNSPLVTITTPVYNNSKEITFAYASVLNQTYPRWEWIVVDDGSTDNVAELFGRNPDDRIQFVRRNENQGRSAARQVSLERSAGKYVCMLDADDWMLSSRLERQVEFLEGHPDHALVSSSMAIADVSGSLIGIRGCNSDGLSGTARTYAMNRLRAPEVAFAPSMFRKSEVGQCRYDPQLLLGEDSHFLMAYLRGRKYASLSDPLYVYNEGISISLEKLLGRLRYGRLGLRESFLDQPGRAGAMYVESLVKSGVYTVLWRLGLKDLVLRKRTRLPTADEARCYAAEMEKVAKTAEQLKSV